MTLGNLHIIGRGQTVKKLQVGKRARLILEDGHRVFRLGRNPAGTEFKRC